MSSPSQVVSPLAPPSVIAHPLAKIGSPYNVGISVLLIVVSIFFGNFFFNQRNKKVDRIPFVLYNGSADKDREAFQAKATEMLHKGRKEHPDKPFFIHNDMGPYLILPSRLAQEVRNLKSFDFALFLKDYYHDGAPGFEPFIGAGRDDKLFQAVTRKRITNHLTKITQPLSEETSFALNLHFGSSTEWHEYTLGPIGVDIIARVSSRILLGQDLCRNEEWLEISKNYTTQGFIAAEVLKQKPKLLRRIYNRFDPYCIQLRGYIQRARLLIGPVVEERRRIRREAIARGEEPPVFNDSIDWLEQEAAGNPYDPVAIQMTISVSAIHSTNDLLLKTMFRIAQHLGLADELRSEISRVLGKQGWEKTALYDLQLLDSVLKETQRLEPLTLVTLNRFTVSDVTLSDGTSIPKGVRVGTDSQSRVSEEYYDDPLRFDPYRFVKWRNTDKDNIAHLVSTSPAQMGFGHGEHACPGRFFAANELKIVLCHLLMKYEWKLVEGPSPNVVPFGLLLNVNPTVKVMLRKREVIDLDLDAL